MDYFLPECNGIDASKKIKKIFPHTKIILFTAFEDYLDLYDLLDPGIDAFLSKDIFNHSIE
jgi:DNA-binding NarL/FixJ family response regulator